VRTAGYADAVRARGVSRPWRLLAGAFFVGALLVGLGVGPVGIGVPGIVESALSHVPFLHVHSPLSSLDCRHYFLRAAAAIARAKSTTRGPQREATLSFTAITRWFFTAAIPLQPGRAATVAAV